METSKTVSSYRKHLTLLLASLKEYQFIFIHSFCTLFNDPLEILSIGNISCLKENNLKKKLTGV